MSIEAFDVIVISLGSWRNVRTRSKRQRRRAAGWRSRSYPQSVAVPSRVPPQPESPAPLPTGAVHCCSTLTGVSPDAIARAGNAQNGR